MSNLVPLPKSLPSALLDYLPTSTKSQQTTTPQQNDTQVSKAIQPSSDLPFVTLTYATSLDSRISAAPGVQTIISHPETKTMTHYIRYHHDAILVGVGTVLADDPGLNCRWTPASDEVNSRTERNKNSLAQETMPILLFQQQTTRSLALQLLLMIPLRFISSNQSLWTLHLNGTLVDRV